MRRFVKGTTPPRCWQCWKEDIKDKGGIYQSESGGGGGIKGNHSGFLDIYITNVPPKEYYSCRDNIFNIWWIQEAVSVPINRGGRQIDSWQRWVSSFHHLTILRKMIYLLLCFTISPCELVGIICTITSYLFRHIIILRWRCFFSKFHHITISPLCYNISPYELVCIVCTISPH